MTNHASMAWLLQFDAFLLLSLAGPNMFMWTYPSNILLFCGCPCFWASKMPRGHKGPKHAGTSDTVTQWMYFGWMTKRSSDHATSSRNCKEMLWAGASLGPDPINWNLRARRPGTRYPKNSLLNLRQEGFQKHFIFSTMEHIFARIYILLSNFKKACWTQRHLLPLRKKVCCQNHKKSGCVTLMMAQHTFKVIWRRLRRRVVTDFFCSELWMLEQFSCWRWRRWTMVLMVSLPKGSGLLYADQNGLCFWLVICVQLQNNADCEKWNSLNFPKPPLLDSEASSALQVAHTSDDKLHINLFCWVQSSLGFVFSCSFVGCHCYHDVFKDGTYPRERCKVFHVLSSSRLDLHDVSNALGFVSTGCTVNQNLWNE